MLCYGRPSIINVLQNCSLGFWNLSDIIPKWGNDILSYFPPPRHPGKFILSSVLLALSPSFSLAASVTLCQPGIRLTLPCRLLVRTSFISCHQVVEQIWGYGDARQSSPSNNSSSNSSSRAEGGPTINIRTSFRREYLGIINVLLQYNGHNDHNSNNNNIC